jgi:hypothetical protein
MGIKHAYTIVTWKPEIKKLLVKPRRKRKTTKVNLIVWEVGKSIQLTKVIILSHSPI